jgi:AraC family transcriptional regulator of adaptative response / DNA-3-methyladenine glycosylase II
MNKEDMFYQAMVARDYRFDGKFFVGVKTTGIYCRPICPAKPKKENVEFFASSLLAEKAGYRPCLRCRPEVAPQSPAWMGTSAIVQRALKKIRSNETLELNEDEFAANFGVGARHLRRLFIEETGKTPKKIAFENRLNLSRQLLTETILPITEIAYASGFQSIRRFNDSFKDRFKKQPSQIRRNKLHDSAPLVVSIAYRPPFNFERLFQFYRSHQVGNLESFENGKMVRVISINGKHGQITISNDEVNYRLKVAIDFPDVSAIHTIISKVRRLFDVDSDPLLIANAFDADPALSKILKKHPGLRVPTGWDSYETAIGIILGQVVSVQQSTRLVAELINLYGEPSNLVIDGQRIKLFPTVKKIANSDLTQLKTTGGKKKTLKEFSKAVLRGDISLESTQNIDDFRSKLLAIKGIGQWTADCMSVKVLGHTDTFPANDLILARALDLHPKKNIECVTPWRSYAAMLIWSEYAQQLKKKAGK